MTVQLYSTSGTNHYVCYRITPSTGAVATCTGGAATLQPQHADVVSDGGVRYVMDTTVHVAPGAVTQTSTGATTFSASSRLTGWLVVDMHLDVFVGAEQEGSFDFHFDAGALVSTATYGEAG